MGVPGDDGGDALVVAGCPFVEAFVHCDFLRNLDAIIFDLLCCTDAADCLEKAGIIFVRAETFRRMGRDWR